MAEEINAGGPAGEEPKGHVRGIWAVTIIAAAALIVGGGIWYYFYKTTVQDTGNLNTVKLSPSTSASASGSTSVSPSTSGSSETANWKTYTNSTYNFSIQYPSDWEYKEEMAEAIVDASVRFNNKNLNKSSATSEDYIYVLIVKNSTINDAVASYENTNGCKVNDVAIASEEKIVDCSAPHSIQHSFFDINSRATTFEVRVESDKNKTVFDKMYKTLKLN